MVQSTFQKNNCLSTTLTKNPNLIFYGGGGGGGEGGGGGVQGQGIKDRGERGRQSNNSHE